MGGAADYSEAHNSLTGIDENLAFIQGLSSHPELCEHLPDFTQGLGDILAQAERLGQVKRGRLIMATAQVVRGITDAVINYERYLTYVENELSEYASTRPGLIGRLDLRSRGAMAQYRRYHDVISAIGFRYKSTVQFRENDKRFDKRHEVAESVFVTPYYTGLNEQLAIVEFNLDNHDLMLLAEVQPVAGK